VIQKHATGWRMGFSGLLSNDADVNAFMQDVFVAERPCLVGEGDFVASFAAVLAKWKSCYAVDEALRVFTQIEVENEVIQLIQSLRIDGIACHVASNQNSYRASYMSDDLGYYKLFDTEFYSCHVGSAKPDLAYFWAVINKLAIQPSQMLFLDDKENNVQAARAAGLRAAVFDLSAGVKGLRRVLADVGIAVSPA
jgi:putative hydrolase of the HAD superfamily